VTRRQRNKLLWCAAAVLGAIAGALASGGHTRSDGLAYDLATAARASLFPADEPRRHVAVIAVDAESLDAKEIAEQELPRAFFAPIWAEMLAALSEAEAAAIGFDLLLAQSSRKLGPEADRPFLRQLAQLKERVVLGRSAATLPAQPYRAALRMDPETLGALELEPERDGVIRQIAPRPPVAAGEPLVGLAARVLARLGTAMPEDGVRLAPLQHLSGIPAYGLADLLRCAKQDPEALRSALKGRAVLIGTYLPEEDRKQEPGRFLPMAEQAGPRPCGMPVPRALQAGSRTVPGVLLHAQAVDQALAGRRVVQASMPAKVTAAAGMGLAGALLAGALMPWTAIAAAMGISAAGALAAVALLAGGLWLPPVLPFMALWLSFAGAYVVRYVAEDRHRMQLQRAFGHYLSPAVVQQITEKGETPQLGGEERAITVLFADLSGFTKLSTQVPAQQLIALVNRYLGMLAQEVDANGGYVDKFIGDAVMAMWGMPIADSDHAWRAAETAARMVRRLEEENARSTAAGGPTFGLKIGMHSGSAVVGNVGSPRRLNYTVIGETVNIASRLEGLAGVYATPVILGPGTASVVAGRLPVREIDRVAVKGRSEPLPVFELLFDDDGHSAQAYAEALALYRSRRFTEAVAAWARLAAAGDGPAATMAERARHFAAAPPPVDWDGSWVMTSK
jgi:adenylate cyclase